MSYKIRARIAHLRKQYGRMGKYNKSKGNTLRILYEIQ